MLQSLHISNYALIRDLDIDFTSGLNIITGQTGAGKSIMIGALSLILGARADTKAIRDPERKTMVEARFDLTENTMLSRLLDEYELLDADRPGDCILRREITTRGTSRAFINDIPVNLTTLGQVAAHLVDIHSQHNNLLINDPQFQLSLVDALADIGDLLPQYSAAYNDYRAALKSFTDIRDTIAREQSQADYNAYQLEKLESLDLTPGLQEILQRERDILANATVITNSLGQAIGALSADPAPVSTAISQAIDSLTRLRAIYPDVPAIIERLESAKIEINDICDTLSAYANVIDADPRRLEDVEDRLQAIKAMCQLCHVENADGLVELRDDLRRRAGSLEDADRTIQEYKHQAQHAKRRAVMLARQISEKRQQAALVLGQQIVEQAIPLGLPNIRCEIQLVQGKLTPTGIDSVQFMFAFNKNQPLVNIQKTASGGEISRVMLAVKTITARAGNLPTIILDEIDTGVSGDIARRMAMTMREIADTTQVIAITHQPQVAARGTTHLKVYKSDDTDATTTHVIALDHEQRVAEIAMMISGDPDDPQARATAADMLAN